MISAVKKILLLLIPFVFFSCGMTVEDASFTAKLDTIDKLIFQSQYTDAQKILKSIEGKSYTAFQYIAISKRYINMKNFESAEKILAKAYKKHPKTSQVLAVYTWVLLQLEDFESASNISEKLIGTSYEGLYSESRIKQYSLLEKDFLGEDFQKEYSIAYNVTGNVKFLQNAAFYECFNGNYDEAFNYHPEKMTNYSNPEFWAYVAYDSGNYLQAINDANYISKKNLVTSYMITADSYLKMRETKLAKQMWDKIILLDKKANPNVLMNCAFSSIQNGNINEAFEYLKSLVEFFPDYVDGLVLYGKFLLHYQSEKDESLLTQALRRKGLKSIDMELADSKPRIPVSDCLYRMEESLKRRTTLDEEKAILQIEYLKLKWLSEKNTSSEQMIIDIWEMIEKNSIMAGTNNSIITDFIVSFFIKQNQFEQAHEILTSVLNEKYGESDYLVNSSSLKNQMSFAELQNVAYLCFEKGLYYSAQDFLEMALKQENLVTTDVFLNLGNFEESKGNENKALDYYSRAINTTNDNYLKSEIYYRIANISTSKNDLKKAKLYLDYSLTLNPSHVKANLLKKQIHN